MKALVAFEAAGRLGSFTLAAHELRLSQAAVSKHISGLEMFLNTKLFLRKTRRVELTNAGKQLHLVTSPALQNISSAFDLVKSQETTMLTIALSANLSRYWLLPLLPELTRSIPNLRLRVLALEDKNRESAEADLTITFESEAPDEIAHHLFGGEVRAMASEYFLANNSLRTAVDVALAPRIEYDAPDAEWVTWKDWARAASVQLPPEQPSLSLSRYQDAQASAHLGHGSMLVWSVANCLLGEQDNLRVVPGPTLSAPGSFYLRARNPQNTLAQTACRWLVNNCYETADLRS